MDRKSIVIELEPKHLQWLEAIQKRLYHHDFDSIKADESRDMGHRLGYLLDHIRDWGEEV